MFQVYCERHEARVLLTTRHIERLQNGPEGVTVDWRCWCGATGRLVRGRQVDAQPAAIPAEASTRWPSRHPTGRFPPRRRTGA
jgi:hypothetical protein